MGGNYLSLFRTDTLGEPPAKDKSAGHHPAGIKNQQRTEMFTEKITGIY
jgi:hypothetical protein